VACGILLATFPHESYGVASLAGILTAVKLVGYAACLLALAFTAWGSYRGRKFLAVRA
jgi:hypothetical protein